MLRLNIDYSNLYRIHAVLTDRGYTCSKYTAEMVLAYKIFWLGVNGTVDFVDR
jgi:hypothetical protein